MSEEFLIDPHTQTLVSMKEAMRLPCFRIDGKPLHVATGWRLALQGKVAFDGVRILLPTLITTRGTVTSKEAVAWWFDRLNGRTGATAVPDTRATNPRQLQIDRAERELASVGISSVA